MTDPLLELERDLVEAGRRRLAGAEAPRRRRRTFTPLVVAAALLTLSGAAYAATKLLDTGDAVAYRFGHAPTPHVGLGTPIAATVQLHPMRMKDPGGGPDWALRTWHTTRGYGCLQIGRFYEGKLGVIGSDGAFSDDGLFHELRPGVILLKTDCIALDGAGHPRLTIHEGAFPASGTQMCGKTGCHATHVRSVDYGFAGPDATSLTYRAGGATRTAQTSGPDGAYLIVGPGRRPETRTVGRLRMTVDTYRIGATPNSPAIATVAYADGSTCTVRPTNAFLGGCPDHGPVPTTAKLPPTAEVRTPVRATVTGPRDHRKLVVTYRARKAVDGQASGYYLFVESPDFRRRFTPGTGRQRCHTATGTELGRDVHAGALVHQVLELGIAGTCTGTFRVRIQYRVQPPHPRFTGSLDGAPGRDVGSAEVRVR